MKKIILLFLLTLFTFNSFGAKITDDSLKIGEPGSVSDKTLKLGDTRLIRSNETTGQLEFTNDGLLYKKIGSGSGSGGDGGVNILANSSFEDGLGDWTTSGGTLTQETYVNALEGNTKYARFVSTTPGEYVESACTTKPDAISGGGMADIRYLGGSGNFDLKVIDCTSGDVEISTGTLADITEWLKAPTQTFDQTAQYKIRVISTAAASIDIDLGYAGSNKSMSPTGKQSHFLGSLLWQETANCVWQTTGTSFSDFGIDSDCDDNPRVAKGKGQDSSSGTLPEINFASMPKGHYQIVITGRMGNTSGNVSGIYRMSDGVNTSNTQAEFTEAGSIRVPNFVFNMDYDTDQTNVTLKLQAKSSGGGTLQVIAVETNFVISVYYFPSSDETAEAFTPEQAEFGIDVNIGGALISTSSNGTPTIPNNASLDMVINKGSAKIACNNAASSGLTCSGSNEAIGLEFNVPRAGSYEVCYTFTNNANGSTAFRAVETELATNTILQTGNVVINPSTPDQSATSFCTDFDFASIGPRVIKLAYEANNSGSIYADRSTSFYERDINIKVRMNSHNVSRPVIQNMVDTKDSNARIQSCRVNGISGTPLFEGNGCASWVDSLTDNGTGQYQLNLTAGVYSEEPDCSVSHSEINGSNPDSWTAITNQSSSGVGVVIRDSSAGANPVDSEVIVMCKGGR